MLVYLVTGIVLLVYLVLVWFLGTWMHPPGSGIWILRGGLGLIGLIAAGSFLWFYRKTKAEESGGENAAANASDDLDADVPTRCFRHSRCSLDMVHRGTLRNRPFRGSSDRSVTPLSTVHRQFVEGTSVTSAGCKGAAKPLNLAISRCLQTQSFLLSSRPCWRQ